MTVEVMTKDDIKVMLKLDSNNIDKVVSMNSFPAPAIDLSQKSRRWLRSAVEQWVVEQYESNRRERVATSIAAVRRRYGVNVA